MISLPVHNGIIGFDICFGSTGSIMSSGIGDLSWDNGSNNDTLIISPIIDTWYYSVYSNSCGTVMDSILIQVNALPQIIAIGDTTVVPLDNAFLSVTGGDIYTWSPSSGLDCSSCEEPIANVSETTVFYVVGTDANGCLGFDSVVVMIEAGLEIFIPNVFSPNGDGENDVFAVEVAGELNNCSDLKIYNRWGQIIFISTGGNTKWDGHTNVGQAVPEGTYFFVVEINGIKKSGSVAVFR
jgi:gliding motility-associated-like protein